jgi:hypothetical protein
MVDDPPRRDALDRTIDDGREDRLAPGASGWTRSTWPTPFCTTTIVVSGPTSRSSQGFVAAVSCDLVARRTNRTGPTSAGSVASATSISRVRSGSSTTSLSKGRPHAECHLASGLGEFCRQIPADRS